MGTVLWCFVSGNSEEANFKANYDSITRKLYDTVEAPGTHFNVHFTLVYANLIAV